MTAAVNGKILTVWSFKSRIKFVAVKPCNAAFTLVELAIVLVIIGLVVGGVLVGKDLIESAEDRSFISQLNEYTTAVNAFKNKYNSIPGDIANATQFFSGVTNGNGDGKITINGGPVHGLEATQFWRHLSLAGMIPGAYDGAEANTGGVTVGKTFPEMKNAKGYGIIVHYSTSSSRNFFQTCGMTGAAWFPMNHCLSIFNARKLDTKVDDGDPLSGKALLRNNNQPDVINPVYGSSHLSCAMSVSAPSSYRTDSVQHGYLLCGLRFDFLD